LHSIFKIFEGETAIGAKKEKKKAGTAFELENPSYRNGTSLNGTEGTGFAKSVKGQT